MTRPLIQVDRLTKTIPGEPTSYALLEVELTIWPGEFVAIIGPSGSGKTTLLSLLGLLARASAGTYELDGTETTTLPEADRDRLRGTHFGFVFQNSFVVGEETVADNVALPLRIQGMQRRTCDERVLEALERVDLLPMKDRLAGELSGGEKQRVAVARALVIDPKMLLADEPTGALDRGSSERLIALLRHINRAGTTVIVVTHDPLIADAADRQINLVDGRTFPPIACVPTGDRPFEADREPMIPFSVPIWRQIRIAAREAFAATIARPSRSLWVMLAYALGIAALVAALGLTNSARGTVVARLTNAESDFVRVYPPGHETASSFDPGTPGGPLEKLRALPGVESAAPVRTFPTASNAVTRLNVVNAPRFAGRIHVTTSTYFGMHGLGTARGDARLIDNNWKGPVAVLGSTAADTLAVAGVESGVGVHVNGQLVPVVAVLTSIGDAVFDEAVYLSVGALPLLGNSSDKLFEVRTGAGYAEPVAAAIPALLDPANPGQYAISSVGQLRALQSDISGDLARLLQVIGVVVVVLSTTTAAISLMLSVRHRAPQIALRRAVGASRAAIRLQYTFEGILVGLLGGTLGTALGVALVLVVTAVNREGMSLGPSVVLLGVGVSLFAGVASSAYPALHAARQDPAAILRQL